jgi:hypothetical protein
MMDIIKTLPIDMQEEGKDGLLKLARSRAVLASSYWRNTYTMSKEDTSFAYGDQWDSKAMESRSGRPTLTLNKLGQFVYRLVGDQRQNVQSIKLMPSGNFDGKLKNTDATKDYKMSEVLEGLVRNIELISNAPYQYKTSFQHAVEGGFGWLRVLTDYAENDSFDLDLKIQAVRHRYSVTIDPDANEPDSSDMNYAFITERMSSDEFYKRYPGKSRGELQNIESSAVSFWGDDKTVVVSEYFVRQPVVRELLLMNDGSTYWMDEVKDIVDEMARMGVKVARTRKVNTHKVLWYKITAGDILEGPKEWVGSTIPIVPVFGKEIALNGKREFRGLIHDAKDAQRMHNYWMSAATERVALAPKSPWVAPAEAIEGFEDQWNTANITNWSVLKYNELPSGARPIRTDPPPMPSQELQIAALSEQGIKSSIGLYDATLGKNSNETSGIAIQTRQQQGDTATFVFTDNLNLAIQRIGKILVEAIPAVYDGNRVIRMHFADGQGDFVEINKSIKDEQTGETVIVHDLGMGKYDVAVTTGPQYLTQRQEAASTMLEFAKIVPQAGQVGADLIASNMDAPNMDIMADRLKKLLPPNMLSPEEQKSVQEGQQPPPPSPEQQQAQAQLQAEQQKMQGDQQMMQIKLEIEKVKLQQAEVSAQQAQVSGQQEIAKNSASGDQSQDVQMIQSMVHDAVAQAMASMISHSRQQQAQAAQQAQAQTEPQSPQEEATEPTQEAPQQEQIEQ